MEKNRTLHAFGLALLILALLSFGAFAQDAAPSVTVQDQAIEDGTVTVEQVVSDGPGWIVIHRSEDDAVGEDIGFAAVADGENTDVVVEIDIDMATEALFAMLHTDEDPVGTYDFPGGDPPVSADGAVVNVAFQVTGLPDTTATPEADETPETDETPTATATPTGTPEELPEAGVAPQETPEELPETGVAPQATPEELPETGVAPQATPEELPETGVAPQATPEELPETGVAAQETPADPDELPETGGGVPDTNVGLLLALGTLVVIGALGLVVARRPNR
ncbi:MAG: LPXTG cell wall anchor domain-containing protein [Anaerolineae bacterium]